MTTTELLPETPVTTPHGSGTLVRIKPGNFRGQDYQVRMLNGSLRWYTGKQLARDARMAA